MQILPTEYQTCLRNALMDWHRLEGEDTSVFTTDIDVDEKESISILTHLTREVAGSEYTVGVGVSVEMSEALWENDFGAAERHHLEREFSQLMNALLKGSTRASFQTHQRSTGVVLTWEETYNYRLQQTVA